MNRRIWPVTVVLLLASLVLPLAAGVAADDNGGRRPIVKFQGPVEVVAAGEDRLGAWTIDGQTVMVVEGTRFNEQKGPADVGAEVVVIARRLDTEDLEAMSIRVVVPAVVSVRIRGFITEVGGDYLVVNDLITVEWNDDTKILGEPAEVGMYAKIEALATPSGYLATKIQILPPEDRRRVVEFEGTIDSIGDPTWQVDGHEITVTEETVIIGEPVVGRWAAVRALESDGTLLALRIKVKKEPEEVQWTGEIEKIPKKLKGFWVVDGKAVKVTPHTEILPPEVEPEEGMTATVTALGYPHRPLEAIRIELEE